jgi:hypothetical protein
VTVYENEREPAEQMNDDREWERKRQEFHGARYRLDMSDKTQEEDPAWLLAFGSPLALPVSQEIQHGPKMGRSDAFFLGTGDADDSYESAWWRDLFTGRRARRYRPAWNGDPGDQPYGRAVIDPDRFSRW